MPQYFQDDVEKWKSNDASTNAAEPTQCTSNVEASGPGLINLYSGFWLRRIITVQLYFHRRAKLKHTHTQMKDILMKLCQLSMFELSQFTLRDFTYKLLNVIDHLHDFEQLLLINCC